MSKMLEIFHKNSGKQVEKRNRFQPTTVALEQVWSSLGLWLGAWATLPLK